MVSLHPPVNDPPTYNLKINQTTHPQKQAYLGFPLLFPAITGILQQGGDREAAITVPRRRQHGLNGPVRVLALFSPPGNGSGGGGGAVFYHQTLREEALRAVGVLGAVSPALYAEIAAAASAMSAANGGGGGVGEKAGSGGKSGGRGDQPIGGALLLVPSRAGGDGGAAAVAAAGMGLTGWANDEDDDEDDDYDGASGHSQEIGSGGETTGVALLPLEQLYPSVAARALVEVLRDPQAPAQHPAALAALAAIARVALQQQQGGDGAGERTRAALVGWRVRSCEGAMRGAAAGAGGGKGGAGGGASGEFRVRCFGWRSCGVLWRPGWSGLA
jgi:hypothetical protein